MTIQRQYVLPNCSLMLEGLSADTSNVLSILANAEFKIIGLDKPLTGGLEFFKAIVEAVNAYCQRLLSGLDHPGHMASQSSLVMVEPGEGQYHRLLVKPELLDTEDKEKQPQTITLSTVQLFDMAEAIDQFFADSQTLPEFSVPLTPLARRHVRSQEPLAERALPPILGVATLAVAGLGLFLLPVPEVSEDSLTQPVALEESLDEPLETTPPDVAEVETTVETTEAVVPAPLTSEQLSALQQQVQQQISGALAADTAFEQPLSYEISVAENGDILGYNPADSAAIDNLDNTPLPALTYIPVDSTTVNPVAQFEVNFGTDGAVTVNPLGVEESSEVVTPEITPEVVTPTEVESPEESDSQSSVPEVPDVDTSQATASDVSGGELSGAIANKIQDSDLVLELNQELRSTIIKNREPDWSAPEVRYRVRLDESGQVVGYEAANESAEQEADALKFSSLVEAANSAQPQLDYLVVISDDGIVEVNPWDGWP